MSKWLIALVTLIYIVTAIAYLIEGNKGMSLVFAGYSVANVGLIWAA